MPAAPIHRSPTNCHCPLAGAAQIKLAALQHLLRRRSAFPDLLPLSRLPSNRGWLTAGSRLSNGAVRPSYEGTLSRSRGAIRPRLASIVGPPRKLRGRREDRVRAAPAVSRAIAHRERAHEHTGSAEASRPSLRSGFTACFVLFPVNGSFATVARERPAPANLTPAPRRQNHTTSPYALRALVLRTLCVHRIPPRVRDVRTPLSSGETRGIRSLICPTARADYFSRVGWTSLGAR